MGPDELQLDPDDVEIEDPDEFGDEEEDVDDGDAD